MWTWFGFIDFFLVKRMKDAAKATMTHLRIEPQSKIAVMNKGYIKQQPGITVKDFVEREVKMIITH